MVEGNAQSEFNMAVSWLNRLNYWFYICDSHSYNLEAHEWLQALMILFRELDTEIKDVEKQKYQELSRDLFNKINLNQQQVRRTGAKGMPQDIYWQLHEFEGFLRRAMDKSGLLKRVQDDALRALK